jgi:alpha,alpha-trehalase
MNGPNVGGVTKPAAESGWDFSSRWFKDPQDINTIHTTDIVPIDLNCLLYHLESMITSAYRLIKQERLAKTYETAARRRAVAIEQYCWDEQRQFYYDYDFVKREKTSSDTLAAIFPLYVGIASKQQAAAVAHKLEKDFLKPGGLVTTLVDNDQQWDSPNGWAPMQHVAIKGLERYGYTELAAAVRERWLSTNQLVFDTHHKFIEKYDVITPGTLGGGGEYELQDGFGWTNGVFEILSSDDI